MPYTSPPLEYQEHGSGGIEEEDEDEEYGQPVIPHVGMNSSSGSSSSDDFVSPDQQDEHDPDSGMFDCPFSINHPVQDDVDASTVETSTSPRSSNLLGIDGIDSRMRGDSLSSMSTNPSAYVVTPALSHTNLPTPYIYSPPAFGAELPEDSEAGMLPFKRPAVHVEQDDDSSQEDERDSEPQSLQPSPALSSAPSSATTRSSRTSRPGDIDIRSISSHAQAEALVQQAQQRIFDLISNPSTEEVTEASSSLTSSLTSTILKSNGVNDGRTPLSARLAAYGESLKIEQKFKEEEEKQKSPTTSKTSRGSSGRGVGVEEVRKREKTMDSSPLGGAKGLDRTFSLEERHHTPRSSSGRVRRPHTAGGTRELFLLCLR